jgi:hypothetical protein
MTDVLGPDVLVGAHLNTFAVASIRSLTKARFDSGLQARWIVCTDRRRFWLFASGDQSPHSALGFRPAEQASVQQTQRYVNVTDEELRKGLEVSLRRRTLKAVAGGQNA